MHRFMPHPATLQLLRFQASARLSRTLSRFRGRRRLMLSVLAVLLAVIWLGQVAAGLLFREPADPQKLAVWIPVGLLAYAIWHLSKTACHTPDDPFQWTAAEQELLGSAPLRRYDLVMYRLIGIATAAVAKAGCFSLVMLPDLRVWITGFVGMLLALLFVDLIRMAVEIVAYGLSRNEFLRFRITVLGIVAIGIGVAVSNSLPLFGEVPEGALPTSLATGLRILNSLVDLRNTGIGMAMEAPFRVFARVILAPSFSMVLVVQLLFAAGLVVSLAAAVVWLDRRFQQRRIAAERNAFKQPQPCILNAGNTHTAEQHMVHVPLRLKGVGSLAWRQVLGAGRYRTSLCVAMIAPGFLSCLTLFQSPSGHTVLFQLVAGLVLYSFLLLPAAFKFDFRRDVDRLAVLKEMPVSPTAVTLGQLAVPVMLCTLFQVLVLSFAIIVRPYHVGLFVGAVLVLLPTNVLIFALENLLFLLYPYRLNQEGLGVFFRSILTFTGKGILLALALLCVLAWAALARHITSALLPGSESVAGGIVFVVGMWAMVTMAAAGSTAILVGVYHRFDPSQDTPAA